MQINLDRKKKKPKKRPEFALKFHFEGTAKGSQNREPKVQTMQTMCLLVEKRNKLGF